jgi:hypothetical protein
VGIVDEDHPDAWEEGEEEEEPYDVERILDTTGVEEVSRVGRWITRKRRRKKEKKIDM